MIADLPARDYYDLQGWSTCYPSRVNIKDMVIDSDAGNFKRFVRTPPGRIAQWINWRLSSFCQ